MLCRGINRRLTPAPPRATEEGVDAGVDAGVVGEVMLRMSP